ncbi:hypothetical protein NNRS527_02104 [Nitrosospira sp. NRS527]|nr:hypothetical protein NNRS527_02104 [Nitrosospira sp. NRS527]
MQRIEVEALQFFFPMYAHWVFSKIIRGRGNGLLQCRYEFIRQGSVDLVSVCLVLVQFVSAAIDLSRTCLFRWMRLVRGDL